MEESQIVKEWMEKGRQTERVQVLRDSLLRVLRSKFPDPWPADLLPVIEGQDDPDTLSHWLDLALAAPTLEAFRAALPT